jgi:hypothetical protein
MEDEIIDPMKIRERKKNTKPLFLSQYIPKYYFGKYRTWLDCASGDGFMVADLFLNHIDPKKYICIDKDYDKLKRLEEKGCKIFNIDLC